MGQYDRTMKLLVDSNPEAMARFVLREWQKQEQIVLPEVKITSVAQLSAEFQSEELDGDNVLLVEGPEGPLYLVEVEFQSTLHPYMPVRSLEYLARTKKKHWKAYGHLPVIAAVIYLFDEENTQEPPLLWPAPDGRKALIFHYLSIKLKSLPRKELLALHEPALWPLVLLTEGEVDRIIVSEMFTDLVEQELYRTLPLGYAIATWLLRDDDLSWLHREYEKMFDLFQDFPAFQWMEESATQRVTERIRKEERAKAEKWVLEERAKAEKRAMREARARAIREERRKSLGAFRQTAIELVAQRFPAQERLAKTQVRTLEEPEHFQQLILRLSLAHTDEEAQDILFALTEEDQQED